MIVKLVVHGATKSEQNLGVQAASLVSSQEFCSQVRQNSQRVAVLVQLTLGLRLVIRPSIARANSLRQLRLPQYRIPRPKPVISATAKADTNHRLLQPLPATLAAKLFGETSTFCALSSISAKRK